MSEEEKEIILSIKDMIYNVTSNGKFSKNIFGINIPTKNLETLLNLIDKKQKQTEELKNINKKLNCENQKLFEETVEQQKEIVELEDFIKHAQIIVPFENTNIKENEPLADIVEVEHKAYISKDKIREKIDYLDMQQKEWIEDRKLKASDKEIIFARDFLNKLLEE